MDYYNSKPLVPEIVYLQKEGEAVEPILADDNFDFANFKEVTAEEAVAEFTIVRAVVSEDSSRLVRAPTKYSYNRGYGSSGNSKYRHHYQPNKSYQKINSFDVNSIKTSKIKSQPQESSKYDPSYRPPWMDPKERNNYGCETGDIIINNKPTTDDVSNPMVKEYWNPFRQYHLSDYDSN